MNRIIVVTTPEIPGKRITRVMGMVRGNSVRARHLGKDIMAVMRMIVGGDIDEYVKLLSESREQAVDRMCADAESLGANAVVMMRFSTSALAQGAAEMLAYGTAVFVEDVT
jgi:uncharacterized protein YbjQ (UPF0145 family)